MRVLIFSDGSVDDKSFSSKALAKAEYLKLGGPSL
jgi:hypothetical protein